MTDASAEATSRADRERLVTLSDGIYAIAMTLLVLDLRIPQHLNDQAFREALRSTWPNLGSAALSFAVLAGFWRDQRRILAPLSAVSPLVTRLTLLGLGLAAVLPYPTTLLAEYASHPQTIVLYAGTIAAVDAVHVTVLLLTRGQTRPSPDAPASAARRAFTAQLVASTVVFTVSIAVAFYDTGVAMLTWVAVVPAHHFIAYRSRAGKL
ncbi:TMEM175 family protein [Streptomyces sp. NPDC005227]|uniref:TMEM175 family protein n=1 Tax=Streptomyces sp. NPDC005227 TaxID=3364707 RepID=UPI0036939876